MDDDHDSLMPELVVGAFVLGEAMSSDLQAKPPELTRRKPDSFCTALRWGCARIPGAVTGKVRRLSTLSPLWWTRRAGMMRRPSMDEAVGLLESELEAGGRGLADLDTEDAWSAYLRFGRRLFDVSGAPDADGLLFQYGIYSFNGPAAFTLSLTRQFQVTDGQGDHDHFVQVECELQYGFAPALQALGSFDSWFFHGAGDDLDEWARGLSGRAAWTTIRTFKPARIRVCQEQV
ncbi:hypothetical protein [Streptomyces sp. I05A-00742]|uniref:hypothetical protein n=1 Tax=Streptomyces sp. I05A-00742 TaxID=2732853 RepID=UPI002016D622|nr:hypothetical protein [Streptomyces sp. I05A-00742]